jgi:histidine triad (HIT) family protein
MPTLFTRILNGEIPGDIVYQDDHCFAIRDINPVAPVHILIIPKAEIPGVSAVEPTGDHQHLLHAARIIAEAQGLASGYRLIINEGADAGQTVPHLHVHLIGGRLLAWPPG